MHATVLEDIVRRQETTAPPTMSNHHQHRLIAQAIADGQPADIVMNVLLTA
jgi:hypothetical protein